MPFGRSPADDSEFVADDNDTGYSWERMDTTTSIPADKASPWLYTTDQKWTIALLKLLEDMNAPEYAFISVLQWARGA
jgi:hypothetical protein